MGTEIESERENIACMSFTCAELNSAMQSRHFFFSHRCLLPSLGLFDRRRCKRLLLGTGTLLFNVQDLARVVYSISSPRRLVKRVKSRGGGYALA